MLPGVFSCLISRIYPSVDSIMTSIFYIVLLTTEAQLAANTNQTPNQSINHPKFQPLLEILHIPRLDNRQQIPIRIQTRRIPIHLINPTHTRLLQPERTSQLTPTLIPHQIRAVEDKPVRPRIPRCGVSVPRKPNRQHFVVRRSDVEECFCVEGNACPCGRCVDLCICDSDCGRQKGGEMISGIFRLSGLELGWNWVAWFV